MKYIIDIPNNEINRWVRGTPYGKKLLVPISIEEGKEYNIMTDISIQNYSELYQEEIENGVWELADYIVRMSAQERDLCFGFKFTTEVIANLSYQEAKVKFEEWQKNEIKIGDEVIENGYKGIITYVHDELCDVLWSDGSVNEDRDVNDLFKTGRHFTGVVELLEKIKGENNE